MLKDENKLWLSDPIRYVKIPEAFRERDRVLPFLIFMWSFFLSSFLSFLSATFFVPSECGAWCNEAE